MNSLYHFVAKHYIFSIEIHLASLLLILLRRFPFGPPEKHPEYHEHAHEYQRLGRITFILPDITDHMLYAATDARPATEVVGLHQHHSEGPVHPPPIDLVVHLDWRVN